MIKNKLKIEKLIHWCHQISLDKIHQYLSYTLVVVSLWFILSGVKLIIATTGTVYGTEFGMQITIVSLLAKLLLWTGLYFLYCWTAKIKHPVTTHR